MDLNPLLTPPPNDLILVPLILFWRGINVCLATDGFCGRRYGSREEDGQKGNLKRPDKRE